jgi:tetratricopeptide (TPR) repeat protein
MHDNPAPPAPGTERLSESPPTTSTCTQCGVSSPLTAAFQPIGRGKKQRLLCPYCVREESHRQSLMSFLNLAFLLVLGSLVAAAGKATNPGWMLLNVALFIVMSWLTILPHEAGHALAARIVGLKVDRIVIGIGRKLKTFIVMGLPIELHQYPAGGLTQIAIRDVPHIRVKWILIVFAGPFVNALLMWVAISWGDSAWQAERIEGGLAPVSTFIAANFLVALGNLWPATLMTDMGKSPTDGAQLFSLLAGKPYDFAAFERAVDVTRLQLLFEREQWSAVETQAHHYLRARPDDYSIQIQLSAALINLGKYAQARDLLENLSDREPPQPRHQAIVANNLAWLYLLLDDPVFGERALELATFAFGLLPWEPFITSTHGCSHALFGDAAIAVRSLSSVRVQKNLGKTRASSLAGLAIAYARLGRKEEARIALDAAHGIDAQAQLLSIAQRKVNERASSSPGL